MSWNWLSFFVGVLVGWLIEWLIDYFYWRRKRLELEEANAKCQEALEAKEAELAACLEEAAAAAPIVVEPQDLRKIEGIGPKIAGILSDNGILNYAQLAAASAEDLRKILDEAGPRYRIANPSSWPEQASLAAEEKWDELQALQDRLTAGRETSDGPTLTQ